MKKKRLRALPAMKATPEMKRVANSDEPIAKKDWFGEPYTAYKHSLFFACKKYHSILKIAIFHPADLRAGHYGAKYELYIDLSAPDFITYEPGNGRWYKSCLGNWYFYGVNKHGNEVWCSERDTERIRTYLKSRLSPKLDIFDVISSYQSHVREQQLDARYHRIIDPWQKEAGQVPSLPKRWTRWLDKVAIPEQYIYYHYKRGGATTGYCSYCEADVPIENPRHNQEGQCCKCGKKIVFKALGKTGFLVSKRHDTYLVQKSPCGLVIREFSVYRKQRRGEYKQPSIEFSEFRRSFFNAQGRPLSAFYYGDYNHRIVCWIATEVCDPDYHSFWGNNHGMVYGRSLPYLDMHGLKYSGLSAEVTKGKPLDPELFLAKYNRTILLEQLKKAKLQNLAKDCAGIWFKHVFQGVAPGPLTKMLGLDTFRLKRLRAAKGGYRYLCWLRHEKKTGKLISDDVIKWMITENFNPDSFNFIEKRMSYEQIRNYISRQAKHYAMRADDVLYTWRDYLSMAKKLNYDTNDEIVYRANLLRQRHDELVERMRRQEIEARAAPILEKYPHAEEVCRSLAEKYNYTGKEYMVIAPAGVTDIIMEGDILHHCLASGDDYYDRIERHESYLLFLRRTSEPDTRFYTMEVEPNGTVRQIRTYYNRQEKDIEDARAFLHEWQTVIAERLTEEDRNYSKKSVVLRKKEFKKLRKDQVKINHGDLAGHLLVEVLMADLMEAA